jgi:hypothetical protein
MTDLTSSESVPPWYKDFVEVFRDGINTFFIRRLFGLTSMYRYTAVDGLPTP